MITILISMVLDYVVGDPNHWYHPVIAIGNLIKFFEKRLYSRKYKKLVGGILVVGVLGTITFIIVSIRTLLGFNEWLLILFDIYALFSAIAYKSLIDASKSVRKVISDDLSAARYQISMFVSRQTDELTKEQILKTIIETVSENTIDGIISPLFFAIIGEIFFKQGVLFIWLYKGINTMDSMIAYKNERYIDFGFVAAKVDDIANFVPARLGSLIMLLAGFICKLNVKQGYLTLKNDHKKSVSVNAGYPESVTAGLLNISLGGLYPYFGKMIEKPIIGKDISKVSIKSVEDTEKLVFVTYVIIFCGLLWISLSMPSIFV